MHRNLFKLMGQLYLDISAKTFLMDSRGSFRFAIKDKGANGAISNPMVSRLILFIAFRVQITLGKHGDQGVIIWSAHLILVLGRNQFPATLQILTSNSAWDMQSLALFFIWNYNHSLLIKLYFCTNISTRFFFSPVPALAAILLKIYLLLSRQFIWTSEPI